MKKIGLTIAGILVVIAIAFLGIRQLNKSQASSTNVQKSKGTITLAATGTSFPTAYKKDGKLVGFDVELANKAAQNLGYKTKWITGEFAGLFGQLDDGKIDTIANDIAITPERSQKYLFSKVYNTEETTIAVNKNTPYKNIKDLEGKTVASAVASNNTENLRKYDSKINIKTFEGRDDIYQALLVGHVDGVVNTRNNLKALIKFKNYKWKVVDGNAATVKIGLPFKKDTKGKKLKKQFDKEFQKLIDNGTVKQLSIKYFGYDITPNLKSLN
ncbi:transporter substrate-binding domain-containing protein [Liquorilactobacillus uvarum]|nr:transporter substrate-binding domain-containing protein [Liquorilactobacillus uvarum]